MSEPETKLHNTTRISKSAIAAMLLGVFGPLLGISLAFVITFLQFLISFNLFPFSCFPFDSFALAYLASWLPAYLFGKKAILKIEESSGSLKGVGFAKIGIKSAKVWAILLPILLFLGILIPGIQRERVISQRRVCGTNLSELGKALTLYADDNNSYPTPDKWCDILLQKNYVYENIFKCPGNKKARCSYSINPNCDPNSEPNTVLVFESKGGWNSYGGPELFTAEHHTSDGGNILYNDGHVEFELTDPNGHFKYELNWGDKK